MSQMYRKMSEAVISGAIEETQRLTKAALDEGVNPDEILGKGLIPGMDVVGQRMNSGEMFIPEVLLSARTMGAGLEILRPILSDSSGQRFGTFLIGTVQGDLHEIGKNLVGMMLEGSGFTVVDLGYDVSPQAFVDAVKEHKPRIVGMSALLTTTMGKIKETIRAIKEAGIDEHLKFMAGGAPVNQDFADQIGADAYADNAGLAVEKAKSLLA